MDIQEMSFVISIKLVADLEPIDRTSQALAFHYDKIPGEYKLKNLIEMMCQPFDVRPHRRLWASLYHKDSGITYYGFANIEYDITRTMDLETQKDIYYRHKERLLTDLILAAIRFNHVDDEDFK